MLETILFQILTPFFINPADSEAKEAYRSGVGDSQHSYLTDKPPTEYPMLTLNLLAYDSGFNAVNPGIYAVNLAPDSKQLLILEAGKIIAKCPVIQFIQLKDELKAVVPSAKVAFVKNGRIIIVYKNNNLEIHGFLYKSSDLPE